MDIKKQISNAMDNAFGSLNLTGSENRTELAKARNEFRENKNEVEEKWSKKYKKSINCKRPKGFSQKQYCKYGKK